MTGEASGDRLGARWLRGEGVLADEHHVALAMVWINDEVIGS